MPKVTANIEKSQMLLLLLLGVVGMDFSHIEFVTELVCLLTLTTSVIC